MRTRCHTPIGVLPVLGFVVIVVAEVQILMKTILTTLIPALVLYVGAQTPLHAQGTAFTYQGRLNSGGSAAGGSYDVKFTLYATNATGIAIAGPVTNLAVAVSNGLFTTTLDFGAGVFAGMNCWLDLAVRTNGAAAFSELAPRQALTPTPYAIFANAASNLLGSVAAVQLIGTIPPTQLPGSVVTNLETGVTLGGAFAGNGGGLTNLNASQLTTGTVPTNVLAGFQAPFFAVIGGGQNNTVNNTYAVVGGGYLNIANFLATVAGGDDNNASGWYSAIPGGLNNTASGQGSFAAGENASALHQGAFVWSDSETGTFASTANDTFNVRAQGGVNFVTRSGPVTVNGLNVLTGSAGNFWQTLGNAGTSPASGNFLGTTDNQPLELRVNGGRALRLEPTASVPNVIGGFVGNLVDNGAQGVTIGGGGTTDYVNHVSSTLGTIAGGSGNTIGTNANDSTIAGGRVNTIFTGTWRAFIGGGNGNTIQTNSANSAIGGGNGNSIPANSSYAAIAGGEFNSAGYGATVGGGFFNIASGTGAFVGGGGDYAGGYGDWANYAAGDYSAVSGGERNFATASQSFIGGGFDNEVDGANSVIGGGVGNNIWAVGEYSTIAGGAYNLCTNVGATVGGGGYDGVNPAAGNIAGGAASTVSGGLGNRSLATYAFIGGGVSNTVYSGALATAISGGMNNEIEAYTSGSYIGGGIQNIIFADSVNSTIGGGYGNAIYYMAAGAVVPGGYNNEAEGDYSFAAGQQAQAMHQGAFVWADSQNWAFSSTINDEFSIRAINGVRIQANKGIHLDANNYPLIVRDYDLFGNNAPSYKQNIGRWGLFMEPYNLVIGIPANDAGVRNFQVAKYSTNGTPTMLMQVDQSGNITNAGSIYSAGSIYTHGVLLTSDRNAKENFAPLNSQAVLAKVAALPVTEWNYKSDEAAQKHIGPMAQDFQAAFQLSPDDKHISVVDEGGVALAAIQGLNEKVESGKQKAEILEARSQQLEAENADLKARLEKLEQLMAQKLGGAQ